MFYLIYIDRPSKDPFHPDYAPSVSLGGTSSCDASSSVLSRHVRLTKRNSRAKGLDAAEPLLSLHKQPRIGEAEVLENNEWKLQLKLMVLFVLLL